MATKRHPVHLRAWWALHALGATADDVAQKLLQLGCLGFRGHDEFCPLAMYLRRKIGGLPRVRKDSFHIVGPQECELPIPCRRFVRRFDAGGFAFLQR